MALARRREQWDHTSNLMALLVNINRDPKRGQAVKASKFHPFPPSEIELTDEEKKRALTDQMHAVRDGFFKGKTTFYKAPKANG
jgi:hypothetical protein